MNRGSLNSYTLNAGTARGGAVRVAADLIASAFIAASARVHRRLTGPMTAAADLVGLGGRRMTRVAAAISIAADITITPTNWIRSIVTLAGSVVNALTAKAGRRQPAVFSGTYAAGFNPEVARRAPAQIVASAQTTLGITFDETQPTTFAGEASIGLTPRTVRIQLVRVTTATEAAAQVVANSRVEAYWGDNPVIATAETVLAAQVIPLNFVAEPAEFVGAAQFVVVAKRDIRQPVSATGAAVIALFAGVQNDFPYDEDAPADRTFIVSPEANLFYVVD